MLLSLSTSIAPDVSARDLGYLLGKHPDRVHTRDLSWGRGHVVFPRAADERASAILFVEVDPVALVRRRGGAGFALRQYVNDRPYVASSFLSVAIARCLGTALGGRCRDRPELPERRLPLEIELPAVPCSDRRSDGPTLLERLFEPLGYAVEATPLESSPAILHVQLAIEARLADVLSHLYVLLPVLDDDKHYWSSDDEIEKLLAQGAAWLPEHPARELISYRYLRHGRLARRALTRLDELAAQESTGDEPADEPTVADAAPERPRRLHDRRLDQVRDVLVELGARRVLDLGCGDGRLLERLLATSSIDEIVGVDVSVRALRRAERRLRLDALSDRQRARLRLLQGALTYRDDRLEGYDAAALVEVVEHLDPPRLVDLEQSVFGAMRPGAVVVTTPNADHNALFERLEADTMRHDDHRFEWSRDDFTAWTDTVAARRGYTVERRAVGDVHPVHGPPTQMAIFRRDA